MAKFCGACGSPLTDGAAFCAKCGAGANPAPTQAAQPTLVSAPTQPLGAPVPTTSSPVLKILLGVVAFLFVFGALVVGGLFYAAHRASQKLHEVANQITGGATADNSTANRGVTLNAATGNYCRLLSKAEVSRAIGVEIVDVHQTDVGCEYLAHGTSADMTAKHAAAMLGARGAPAEQQKQIEQFASGIFNSSQSQSRGATQDENGNTVVLAFGIDPNSARTQLHLNEKVLGGLGPGSQPIAGIGDEAFDAAGGMMMVRKGDNLVRIMYTSCPCDTEAIKPLAQRLADAL